MQRDEKPRVHQMCAYDHRSHRPVARKKVDVR